MYARPIYRAEHLPSAEITSAPAAVSRVAEQAAEGANGVKLFTGAIVGGDVRVLHMSAAAARAITGEAHRLGLTTFAHPTDAQGAEVAIDNAWTSWPIPRRWQDPGRRSSSPSSGPGTLV